MQKAFNNRRFLRDLLYFDLDKAASLWSQLAGGLREKVALTTEAQGDKKGSLSVGVPKLLEATIGGSRTSKESILESKTLHHDLLNLLEEELTQLNLVTDLNGSLSSMESSPDAIRAAIGTRPYVIAQGASAIEDCQRIYTITNSFNPIVQFIAICAAQSQPELQQMLKDREDKRRIFESESDKHKKQRLGHELNRMAEKINSYVTSVFKPVDQWLLDGIRLFVDTYMRGRINFRVFPFEACPSFFLLCNLKRDCFVDQDLEHLLFGYTTRPTVPLAVFGLITSIPAKDGVQFDPIKEFEQETLTVDTVVFEKAFRGIFSAIEGIEVFVRYSRYPNISVHPIAVFRQFELPSSEQA
jgi:hypothetical protein